MVCDISCRILKKITGEEYVCISQDTIDDNGDDENDFDTAFPVEYLNLIDMICILKHDLEICSIVFNSLYLEKYYIRFNEI